MEPGQPEPDGAMLRQSRAAFDRWERFASTWPGTAFMFAWALGEATVWPIIPDFLLVPMAAGNRRRFWVSWAAAVSGMALGGTATFMFTLRKPDAAMNTLRRLPMVSERGIAGARSRLARDGIRAYWLQPWSGIPSKVWAVVGGTMKLRPALTIPTFVLARSLRMAVFAALAGLLARRFERFLRDYSIVLLIVYTVLFSYGLRRLSKRS